MGVSKVEYGGNTLIDLTDDTIMPETMFAGETAHDAAGEPITGTFTLENEMNEQGNLIEQIKSALVNKVSGGTSIPVTPDDEGKFLSVVNGTPTWVELPVAEDIEITIAEEITFNE